MVAVTVKRAVELPVLDIVGERNPFVVLKLVRGASAVVGEYRTATVKRGGSSPVWSEASTATGRFSVVVEPGTPLMLHAEVFDEDVTSNTFVGSGEVDILSVATGRHGQRDFLVSLRRRDGKLAGQLTVCVGLSTGVGEPSNSMSIVLRRLAGEWP